MNGPRILPGIESMRDKKETCSETAAAGGSLRFRRPDRRQMQMMPMSLDETIPAEHHVRVFWELVGLLDVSEFAAGLKVGAGEALWSATDVRLLVALWLYAGQPTGYTQRAAGLDDRQYGRGPFDGWGIREVRADRADRAGRGQGVRFPAAIPPGSGPPSNA